MTTEPIATHDIDPIEHNNDERGGIGRRGAFAAAGGGLAAVAAAFAAFGRDSRQSVVAGSTGGAVPAVAPTSGRASTSPHPMAPTEGDLAIGVVAASLEQLAVNTYGAALTAAGSGALGAVPPAVAEFVTTAKNQHQAALDAWNGVLTGAGKPAVNAAPAELEASVNAQFGQVTDIGGAAQLALMLEQVAAATYLDAIGKLESPEAIALAGSIQPIDRQHVAILLFALGMYPVPEVFATTEQAFAGGPLAAPMMPGTL